MAQKKELGQYFTPDWMAKHMVSLLTVKKDAKILEPSAGSGILVNALLDAGFKNVQGIEIDGELDCVCPPEKRKQQSFLDLQVDPIYDAIFGNPPYVRWKNLPTTLQVSLKQDPVWMKYCTSLSDYLAYFIIKSVLLLKQGGELVFITSDYWLSTLHSQNLRMFLIQNGSFECIHSFGEKPVFKSVNTSIIVFKFVKGRVATDIRIEEMEGKDIHPLQPDACKIRMKSSHCIAPFANQERWNIGSLQYDVELARLQRLCFDPHLQRIVQVNDVCDIANGMVSGLDRAFQIPHIEYVSTHPSWMVPIVKAKHLRAYGYDESIAYCMIPSGLTEDAVRQGDPQMYAHLLPYRSLLEKRFSYGRDLPFWEWAFPRSFKRLSQTGLKIFVPSKERVKPYRGLRFALVDTPHMPTQDVTAILLKDTTYPIQYVAALLNHPLWAKWFLAYGVIKGGVLEFSERPLSRAPFLSIDFQNTFEVHICQKIVDAVDRLRFDPTPSQNDLIVKLVDELLANKDVQVTNCI